MTPSWFRIVRGYPNLNMGPTVSFVLGAIRNPIGRRPYSPRVAERMLRELIGKMREDAPRQGQGVRVVWCGEIGAHVISANPMVDSLSWDKVDGCEMVDHDGLSDVLWERYRDPITAGEFSLDDRVWRRFRRDEIANIRALLSGARR